MLHLHDFYHMKIRLCWGIIYRQDSIRDSWRELFGKRSIKFSGKRCSGDRQQEFSVDFLLKLECIQELFTLQISEC